MSHQPNVLLVMADQWRSQACGYAGNVDVQTPNLDSFARQALNCRLAANGCPVCCPARASLLTALLPDRHGVFLNDAPLNPKLPSLGKHFRDAGYDTAWIGKWHVDGHGRFAYIPPARRQGFSYWKAMECTHAYNHSRYFADDPVERAWDGYDATAQTDDLIGWLGSRPADRPFLGVLSWGPPHNPYHTAPAQFQALYPPDRLTLRDNVPAALAERARRDLAGYYAHCTALDFNFGKLLAALQRLGRADNTYVLFTSDHGDMIGSHGLWEKQNPWDESIRVPFLLRGPGVAGGSVSDLLIEWVDFWPTLARLCGLPVPAGVQGRDHGAHLLGGTVPADNACFYGSYHVYGTWGAGRSVAKQYQLPGLYHVRDARGLRTTRYTYAIDHGGPWLLYDNDTDPCQQHNLVGLAEYQTVQQSLHRQLQSRMRQAQDTFPSGQELVKRWGYTVEPGGEIGTPGWGEWERLPRSGKAS